MVYSVPYIYILKGFILLMAAEKKNLVPEVNIGLVGHVDHGKTTLNEALTGRWTDTHSEERKRGITIKIGYSEATMYKCPKCAEPGCYGTTPKCIKCFSECKPVRMVSFVDAPGHETLMATVLSGAALMDGAILVISASEHCPQPQTREHLTTLDIVGIKKIVVVQNKIDLVTPEQARKSYQEIKAFLKGSVAEDAPIIPVSSQQRINMDLLVKALEEHIPTPKRDRSLDPIMFIARSFDTNKPGTPIKDLEGGVLGGSLVQGTLSSGEEVEIRPGLKIKDSYEPVKSRITGLQKAMKTLKEAGPGGLIGLSTTLDPYLAKSDGLAGNVLGRPGKMPPVIEELKIRPHLMERVVGSKEDLRVERPATGIPVMITVNTTKTVGVVTSSSKKQIEMNLKMPICANMGDRVAMSVQVQGRWRLIGWGEIQ